MSEPKKIDRRKFIYAGLGAVALVAIGAAAYFAMKPPVVTQPTTVVTTVTQPTTTVVTTSTSPSYVYITPFPTENITIKFFEPSGAASPVTDIVNKKLNDKYMALHPNIKLDYNPTPFGVLYNQITTMYMAGEAPDVFCNHGIWYFGLAKMGVSRALEDFLTPEMLEDCRKYYFDEIFWDYSWKGKHYSIPRVSGPHCLIYNPKLFEQFKVDRPPKDFKEMYEIAKQCTDREKGIVGFAYANDLAAVDRIVYFAYIVKNWADVDLVDWSDPLNPKPNAKDPVVAECIEWLAKTLADAGPPNVTTLTLAQMQTLFGTEKAAMVLEGQYFNQWMLGIAPRLKFTGSPYPSNLTNKWYAGQDPTHWWTVSTHCKHPLVAYDFIRWYTNPENDWEVATTTGWYPVSRVNRAKHNPVWPHHDIFNKPECKFYTTRWLPGTEGARIGCELMNEVFLGKKTGKEFANSLQEKLEAIWPKYL
jgi:ABC-type glycerol-3-phosphate transport system substrate-binding protein